MKKTSLAPLETEAHILGSALLDEEVAGQMVLTLREEMFSESAHRLIFEALSLLHARGAPTDMVAVGEELRKLGTLEGAGGYVALADLSERGFHIINVEYHATIIRKAWQARSLAQICRDAAAYLKASTYHDGGRKLANKLASRALSVYSLREGGDKERVELLDELWVDTTEVGQSGIPMPWPALDSEIMGPMVGGEVIGQSAYSGGGKSTLSASIVRGVCRQGTPALVFATEMGKRWLARTAAADSRTSQWCAEKNRWQDSPAELERYRDSLERIKKWPLEISVRPNVSVAEIINSTRILRERYEGQTVLVVVDHLHRLDYGREDPNKMVGWATKQLKNYAMEDGKLVFLLLYQPRKPEEIEMVYKPVAFHQVRGDALVGNELDTHISPFRAWVKVIEGPQRTPWGTRRAHLNPNGLPVVVDPPKAGTLEVTDRKLDDEHVFIKVDKRRIGGAGGIVVLNFHEPSGLVTDMSLYDEGAQVSFTEE